MRCSCQPPASALRGSGPASSGRVFDAGPFAGRDSAVHGRLQLSAHTLGGGKMKLWQRADAGDLRSLAAFGASVLGSLGIGLAVLKLATSGTPTARVVAIGFTSLMLLSASYAIWPLPRPRLSSFALYPLPWGAIIAIAGALGPLLRNGELPRARIAVVVGIYAIAGVVAFILITRRGMYDSAEARRPTSGCS